MEIFNPMDFQKKKENHPLIKCFTYKKSTIPEFLFRKTSTLWVAFETYNKEIEAHSSLRMKLLKIV